MCEKLLLAIALTFALHLSTQIGLLSLNHSTQRIIQNETNWFVAQKPEH